MKQIDVSDDTHRALELLAAAWQTTVGDALNRLVTTVATGAILRRSQRPERPAPAAQHNVYGGIRTEATSEPDTHLVTVCSGPLCGQSYTSPSGARRAVVGLLSPSVSPMGNGWDLWTVTTTGATLRTSATRKAPADVRVPPVAAGRPHRLRPARPDRRASRQGTHRHPGPRRDADRRPHTGLPATHRHPRASRFSRIYVIQVSGDHDAGTVTLAALDGGAVTVNLPPDFRYRKASPTQLSVMLAAVEAEYPPHSLTAGLAEALAAVLDVCARARSQGRTVPVEAIEEALTVPLRPFLDAWTAPAPVSATSSPSTEEDH